MKLIMKKLLIMMMMSTNLSLPRSRMGSCSLKLRASGWTSSRGRPFTCIQQEYCLEKGWTLHCIVACTENFIPRIVFVFQTHLDQSLSTLAISHSSGRLLAPKDLIHILSQDVRTQSCINSRMIYTWTDWTGSLASSPMIELYKSASTIITIS